VKVEKTVTWGNIGAMIFPVMTLIVMFITMRNDIDTNKEDIAQLQHFNENIGQILTSHTTQLAVKDVQFQGISKSQEEIKKAIERVEITLADY